jgi:excinuclease UvrABC nuclease subunit
MLKDNNDRRSDSASAADPKATEQEYKIRPGSPPKEYQYKPGQSGNPKGAKRKKPAMDLDLKAALELALNKTITLKQGEKERTVTMATAGIEQLVTQYVKGNRGARRDLFALADRLGVDFVPSQKQAIQESLTVNHEAILKAYVDRQNNKVVTPARQFAPTELLDDDPQDQKGK